MAAVSIGSWFFPALGQRSTSCGPSPTTPSSPPTPDKADVVGPPWRGPDHLVLIKARQSSFISPTHLAGPCRAHALRGDVWHILHSPVLPLTGWCIWHLDVQIWLNYCQTFTEFTYKEQANLCIYENTEFLHSEFCSANYFISTVSLKLIPPYIPRLSSKAEVINPCLSNKAND